MKITKYNLCTAKDTADLKIACVSDLHAHPCQTVLRLLEVISPDIILLAGDIMEIPTDYMEKRNKNAICFLEQAAKIAPCFYCFGNHEIYYSHAKDGRAKTPDPTMLSNYKELISNMGIHILNDEYTTLKDSTVHIGGLVCGYDKDPNFEFNTPNTNFLKEYDKITGFKILICHYPHYYTEYLKSSDFDMIVSGHAHGGQWRIFGQGIYAPHQGIFPKYTSGIYDNRFIISRGASNNSRPIPRFFNPTEVLEIQIHHSNK